MFRNVKTYFGIENITTAMMLYYVYKRSRQEVLYRNVQNQVVAPIFACQRSGTSLILRVFFWDKDNIVYREGSSLSSRDPEHLRLDPLPTVAARIRRDRAPLVILKPLVESQNAAAFMEVFPEARPIWLYRNYRDVVASNLRKFGERNGIDDIRPIAQNDNSNWRAEKVSDYTRSVINQHFAEDMSIEDAAALFWFARNQLFFEQNLDTNPRMLLIRYRDLASAPSETMRRIYAHLQRPYPGDDILREIHGESVGKGGTIQLSPQIAELCEDLFDRLNTVAEQARKSSKSAPEKATS